MKTTMKKGRKSIRTSNSALLSTETKANIAPYQLRRKINKLDQNSWTVQDKQKLCSAMEKVLKPGYFVSNSGVSIETAKKIKSLAPSISHGERGIHYYLKQNCGKVRDYRKRHDTPIDKWVEIIDAVTPDHTDVEQQLISTIMAAIEEDVPELTPKSNTSKAFPEPDYGEIYKYLACAIASKPLPDLSPVSALVVEECMQSLTEQIKSLDDNDLRKNLRSTYLYLIKGSADAAEEDEEEVINQLNTHSSIVNPLAVSQSSIIPVPPNL